MISGNIEAAGAGEDNRDIINARIIRSNNATAETAYGVGTYQIDGVVTVFAESNCLDSFNAAICFIDGSILEGKGVTVVSSTNIITVGTSTTGDGSFLPDDGGFTGNADIRIGGGLGDFYICFCDLGVLGVLHSAESGTTVFAFS